MARRKTEPAGAGERQQRCHHGVSGDIETTWNRQVNTRVMNTNSEHEGDERRGEHEGEDGNLVLRTRGRGLEMRVAPLGVEEANRR